jgi:hypothetical protein
MFTLVTLVTFSSFSPPVPADGSASPGTGLAGAGGDLGSTAVVLESRITFDLI